MPAKGVRDSKTRLGRHDLTVAFLTDVLLALRNNSSVTKVIVVTPDPVIEQLAKSLQCEVLTEVRSRGLSAAIQDGLDVVNGRNQDNVLVLLGDLPCLTADHIDSFIALGSEWKTAFLTDSEGTGTTMWLRTSKSADPPQFGARSRAKHRESGAHEISGDSFAGARRDVDTEVNLWDAIRIGVGSATLAALTLSDSTALTEPSVILTISGVNPLRGVDESGATHRIHASSHPTLRNPRIGQRVVVNEDQSHAKN